MSTIHQVIASKGDTIHTVESQDSVFSAIHKMAELNIGSLLVMENERFVGLFTERHYARDVFLKGRSSPETRVGEIMERNVVCIRPDQTVEDAMAVMNAKRIRHLPVIDDGRLIGIVSIGDLVKSVIEDKEFVIEQLVRYIHQ